MVPVWTVLRVGMKMAASSSASPHKPELWTVTLVVVHGSSLAGRFER